MRRALSLLVVLALVTAACGGDDASSGATTALAPVAAPLSTSAASPSTTPAAPTTTDALAPTTTPAPTTTSAPPTTTTTPPGTTAAPTATSAADNREGVELPAAVEGTLLGGLLPEGFDILQLETTTPRAETCPGTVAFGGVQPVAFSETSWASDALTGPFLDVYVARFESADIASEAFGNYRDELIACGEFPEPQTGAIGAFRPGEDPALGEESFATDYTATYQGLPINRFGVVVRVGDSMYSSGLTTVFLEPDPAIVLTTLNDLLGQ